MGKDLKGKELGAGIVQRKDGKYCARFISVNSKKRVGKYFDKISDAKRWLREAKYEDEHKAENTEMLETSSSTVVSASSTVDTWFNFWLDNIVVDLSPNTRRNYKERYIHNIKPIIGDLLLTEVKPLHCKLVLNQMEKDYAGSTIRQTYITMGTFFKSALNNDMIARHPMNGVQFTKPVRAVDDVKYLTVKEQKIFLEAAKRSHNYYQYALILETGLRTGEMIGLTWSSVDLDKRTLTVDKTLEYRHGAGFWRAGPPKTVHSYRTIPLTNRAYEILKELNSMRSSRKEAESLSTVLEYMDRRSGCVKKFEMRDLVFINYRTGEPAKNSSYDTHLYKLCDEAKIRRFCMHALRHTYATRAIESGMQPKVLQKLLGHASIKTTMDRYVHVTEDSMQKAVSQFEDAMANFA